MDELRQARKSYRGLWVVSVFALFVAALVMLKREPTPGLCVLGDARERQAGRIPTGLVEETFDAGAFSLGVGNAAIGGWEGLGEALIVGGETFVRNTDFESPQYFQLQRASRFRSSTLAAVSAGVRPRERLALTPGSSMSDVLQSLASRYPEGVLAAGFVQFEVLRRFAISRPPIRGEAILARPARYYTEPMESGEQVWAFVVALAMGNTPVPASPAASLLPLRTNGAPESFAMALALAAPPALTDETPNRSTLRNLGRVSSGSAVARGDLALYPARPLGRCTPARN